MRQVRCRRFSRPFTRPTVRVHVLRLRGRQRAVRGGSRGCWRAWRGCSRVEVFSRESVCCVVPVTSAGDTRRMSREACLHVVSLSLLGGVPPLSLNIEGEENGCCYDSRNDVPRGSRR